MQANVSSHSNDFELCRSHLSNYQIERATNLLMDFCKRKRSDRQKDAILLTARWSRITEMQRKLGDTEQLRAEANQLILDILVFLDELELIFVDNPFEQKNSKVDFVKNQSIAGAKYTEAREAVRSEGKSSNLICSCDGIEYRRNSRHGIFDLKAFDLKMKAGKIAAMVGSNGAGKSTLMSLLSGDLASTKGNIKYYFDKAEGGWYQRKGRISFVRQHPEPWKGPLIDVLRFESACVGHRGEVVEREVSFILHRLRLERFSESTWSSLSGGYRTRFELARALIREPQLLLLDEPLAHLDMNAAEAFLQDLVDLSKWPERPISVVISSQHIYDIELIADEVVLLKDGEALIAPKKSLDGAAFELQCNAPDKEFLDFLGRMGVGFKFESHNVYRIIFEECLSATEFLKFLLSNNIQITYFREITSSSRRLL